MTLQVISKNKSFEGLQCVYSHFSEVLGCEMKFGVYLPPICVDGSNTKCPVLYYLSGLTCTHENFIHKSGMQKYAAEHGIIVVNPDTSPRGLNISGEDDVVYIGTGAGFYVDATEEPWSKNYKMYSYVTKELVDLVNANLPVIKEKKSIFGHSMGGHGALMIALKNPGSYLSVSAFAPLCNPTESVWGEKAFGSYLGTDTEVWKKWDSTCLAESYEGPPMELFIECGTADEFLKSLHCDKLVEVVSQNKNLQIINKKSDSYDHSYYFIASFIEQHIEYHAKFLKQ